MSENPKEHIGTIVILEVARALLAEPGGWTQCVYARDKWGERVAPTSPDAAKFCMIGAVTRAVQAHPERGRAFYDAEMALGRVIGGNIAAYNDAKHTTQRKVLAIIDKAIENLRRG